MDKIFVDEAVSDLHTIQDMLRWAVSRFSAANIWYGHGTDNPWDEAVQLVLPSLYLPLDIPEDMRTARLTSIERHRKPGSAAMSSTLMNVCWCRALQLVS